jgi:Transposase domain (DUF772)
LGRPGIETRFVIGLLLLKHIYGLSDEGVCDRWVYDPYFQLAIFEHRDQENGAGAGEFDKCDDPGIAFEISWFGSQISDMNDRPGLQHALGR